MARRVSHLTSYACMSNFFPSMSALICRFRVFTTSTVLPVARTRTLGTSSAATGTFSYALPGGKAVLNRLTRSNIGKGCPPPLPLVGVHRQPAQSVPFSFSGFQ